VRAHGGPREVGRRRLTSLRSCILYSPCSKGRICKRSVSVSVWACVRARASRNSSSNPTTKAPAASAESSRVDVVMLKSPSPCPSQTPQASTLRSFVTAQIDGPPPPPFPPPLMLHVWPASQSGSLALAQYPPPPSELAGSLGVTDPRLCRVSGPPGRPDSRPGLVTPARLGHARPGPAQAARPSSVTPGSVTPCRLGRPARIGSGRNAFRLPG
jgi:hypothetical protein